MKKSIEYTLGAILCTDSGGRIGNNNELVYRSKTDMSFFKEQTNNKVLLMGYKTFLSIPNIDKMRERVQDIVIVLNRFSKEVERDLKEQSYHIMYFNPKETTNSRERFHKDLSTIASNFYQKDSVETVDFMIIGGSSLYNNLEILDVEYLIITLVEVYDKKARENIKADTFFDLQQLKAFRKIEILEEHSNQFRKLTMLRKSKKATP